MSEKWTLAEGFQEVLQRHTEEDPDMDELATFDRKISLTIALIVVKAEGEKYVADGTEGISVTLQSTTNGDYMFERSFFPEKDGTLEQLLQESVMGLGIDSEECIWEEGQQ